MSQTARGIEQAGIPTVTVYAHMYRRWAIERLRFPRLVLSRFFLGRLLGEPGHADRQHSVIGAALALLEHADGPEQIVELPYRWMRSEV